MKKILLSALVVAAYQLQAQQWVKTTVEKRNVVLEEFTGIHCGYCPDGHKIANGMVDANPGRVFLVNVHAGGYANPSAAGDIDLRTTMGTAIDQAAAVSGYPAGSVNRANTPWGQSRSAWSSLATPILAQNSVVNVAVKATIDIPTRVLTTEVEVYYTGASAKAKNYLNVVLTEDDILGPQSDYGNYNPTNWVDGQYKHNHVLRQALHTGAANGGEQLDTTTTGKYYYRKYTTTIPANYPGSPASPCSIFKLNVVAFVTEDGGATPGGNILSGNGVKVDFDPAIKADLKLTDLTVKPTSWCFNTINPKVEVTNNLTNTITAFDITATINGKDSMIHYSGSLGAGQKTTIDWGAKNIVNTGSYKVVITGFKNVMGSSGALYDIESSNDVSTISGVGFASAAFASAKYSFESGVPNNVSFDNTQNANMVILTSTALPYYGNHGSKSAVVWKLHSSWNVAGKPAHIMMGEVDFSANADPGISFYYAHSMGRNNPGTSPTLSVSASEDCGATWTTVKTFTAAITGWPSDETKLYVPVQGEYIYVNTSLSSYKNKKVLLRITGTPGSTGNALLVDEINVGGFTALSAKEVASANNPFEVYPNPASTNFTVKLSNPVSATISVVDITGKQVISMASPAGDTEVDCSTLKTGVYFVEVTTAGSTSKQKLVITR